jgi:hypothetical protein
MMMNNAMPLTSPLSTPLPHFGANIQAGFIERQGYRLTRWLSQTLPQQIDHFATQQTLKNPGLNPFKQGWNLLINRVQWLGKTVVDQDYRSFPKAFGTSLVQPPMGMLSYLLFPLTIGPRVIRAYERGKPYNDYREIGDILRRDLLTVTIFLYGLDPLNRVLMGAQQKLSGLKLLQGHDLLKYSDIDRYYSLSHPEGWRTLVSMLDDGHEKGLRKAMTGLYDGGLAKQGEPKLQKLIGQVTEKLEDLMAAHQYHRRFTPTATSRLHPEVAEKAQSAVRVLQHLEAERVHLAKPAAQAMANLQKQGRLATLGHAVGELFRRPSAATLANRLPKFTEFVAECARTARNQVDVLSFGLIVVAIGWLPLFINQWINEIDWQKKQAAKQRGQMQIPEGQLGAQDLFRHLSSAYQPQPTPPGV